MRVYILAISYIAELWIFTSYHFSSAPRKSSCWNAGSNFFLGLKKKILLFCFHFWRTVFLGWQVFLLLLFSPLSASERCLWSAYNWTRTQLSSRLSLSVTFPPLSLVCSNLVVFYFRFLCVAAARIQGSGCIYSCFQPNLDIGWDFMDFYQTWKVQRRLRTFSLTSACIHTSGCIAACVLCHSHSAHKSWKPCCVFSTLPSFASDTFCDEKYQNLPQSRSSIQYIIN